LLEDSDGEAVDLLEGLAATLPALLGSQRAAELERAVRAFDFDAAASVLRDCGISAGGDR
jgi:hypothetical protein